MINLVVAIALAQVVASGDFPMPLGNAQTCGALAVERNARVAEVERRNAALNAKNAELNRRQQEIEATREKVRGSDNGLIAEFNRQVQDINLFRVRLKPEIAARDAYVAQSNAAITRYNETCANRSFDTKAVAALPPEQRLALSGKATTNLVRVPPKSR